MGSNPRTPWVLGWLGAGQDADTPWQPPDPSVLASGLAHRPHSGATKMVSVSPARGGGAGLGAVGPWSWGGLQLWEPRAVGLGTREWGGAGGPWHGDQGTGSHRSAGSWDED